jgi:hypothetical protein
LDGIEAMVYVSSCTLWSLVLAIPSLDPALFGDQFDLPTQGLLSKSMMLLKESLKHLNPLLPSDVSSSSLPEFAFFSVHIIVTLYRFK